MSQFSVYLNANIQTSTTIPLLLNVQSGLIANLGTCMVVPLCHAAIMNGKLLKTLMPVFEIENMQYAMLTPQLAGISTRQLGNKLVDLSHKRDEILLALDMLITGI